MVALGIANKTRIYVVRNSYPKPTNINQFMDYTSFFTEWKVSQNLNNLAIFDGKISAKMNGASPSGSGTRMDDIKIGSNIYVLAGNSSSALISKFRILKPVYNSISDVRIFAVQSSGSEEINKTMYAWIIPLTKFKNQTLATIFNGTGTIRGLTRDPVVHIGETPIIAVGTITNQTEIASLTLDNLNRIDAVSKACDITQREWIINHGTNSGAIPFSAGDSLDILDRVGSASSTKIFYLTGANQNCKLGSGTEEIDSTANDVILQGRNISC
jgi:hypothetical protein